MLQTIWKPMSHKRVEVSEYLLWAKTASLGLVFQLTNNGLPPPDDMGGYYNLNRLLELKGL